MQKLSQNIADILLQNNAITVEDRKRCQYGLELILSSFSEILSVVLLSMFLGNLLETITFFVAFIALRIYAGGYHADTKLRCFIILIGVYVLFTVLVKILPVQIYQYVMYMGAIFSLVIVSLMAPVQHSRKSLTKKELQAFRKIALVICYIELLIIFIWALCIGKNIYLLSFVCGQLAVSFSMFSANIKNKLRGGENNEKIQGISN